MKITLIIIILGIIVSSCSSTVKENNTIELISYGWHVSEVPETGKNKLFLSWGIYTYIEDSGDAYVCFNNYGNTTERRFIKILLDKRKIENLIETSKKYSKTLYDYKKNPPMIYDGPSYKLRINYDDKSSKDIEFTDSHRFEQDTTFVNFYDYIWLRCRIENHDFLIDTAVIAVKLDKFIEDIRKDRANTCIPPPPEVLEQKVKFTKPKHKKN